MGLLLLAAIFLVALIMIPLGLPGTWVMLAAGIGFDVLHGGHAYGAVTIIGVLALAGLGEWFEFTLTGKYARKYGGSRRASWGAMIGGVAGAMAGFPVPIVGPMIGAFAGAFAGALLAEWSRGSGYSAAEKVAWGAFVGRAASVAVKMGIGCAIAAWLLLAAWQSA